MSLSPPMDTPSPISGVVRFILWVRPRPCSIADELAEDALYTLYENGDLGFHDVERHLTRDVPDDGYTATIARMVLA